MAAAASGPESTSNFVRKAMLPGASTACGPVRNLRHEPARSPPLPQPQVLPRRTGTASGANRKARLPPRNKSALRRRWISRVSIIRNTDAGLTEGTRGQSPILFRHRNAADRSRAVEADHFPGGAGCSPPLRTRHPVTARGLKSRTPVMPGLEVSPMSSPHAESVPHLFATPESAYGAALTTSRLSVDLNRCAGKAPRVELR